MQHVNRVELAVIRMALRCWRAVYWYRDLRLQMRESHWMPLGADDENWQHTLEIMAEPIREHRLAAEETASLPILGVPVVTGGGEKLSTTPPKPRKRTPRAVKVAIMTGAAEVLAIEKRVMQDIDRVVRDAMLALGLDVREVNRILRLNYFDLWAERLA